MSAALGRGLDQATWVCTTAIQELAAYFTSLSLGFLG